MHAAHSGHTAVVETLVGLDANVQASDDDGTKKKKATENVIQHLPSWPIKEKIGNHARSAKRSHDIRGDVGGLGRQCACDR